MSTFNLMLVLGICVVCLRGGLVGGEAEAEAEELLGVQPANQLRCPPAPAHCTHLETNSTKKMKLYKIEDDQILRVYFAPYQLTIQCNERPLLESGSLPRFSRATHLSTLGLYRCYAPRGTYSATFTRLNITQLDVLEIKLGRSNKLSSPLLPKLFVDLNVSKLHILGSFLRPVYPENGFFDSLHGVQHLDLMGISIPPLSSWNRIKSVFALSGKSSGEWGGCDYLEELSLHHWDWDRTIPTGWLANCSRLQLLSVNSPNFQNIINNGFILPRAVHTAIFERCKLKTLLSSDIFARTKNLTRLDLNANFISNLPSDVFMSSTALQHLILDSNPLGDLCDLSGNSLVDNSTGIERSRLHLPLSLMKLSLSGIGVTRICASWPTDLPRLTELDLSHNSVTQVQYKAVQWLGERRAVLNLNDAGLRAIVYERPDYQRILELNCTQINMTLQINKPLICDCHTYWFAKTLAACPDHLSRSVIPKCRPSKLVTQIPIEDMICRHFRNECTPGCKCFSREDIGATIANCSNTELDHIPVIPRLSRLYAHSNHIGDINSTDIPDTLIHADLRNNSISRVSAASVQQLFSVAARRLLLSGNPLLCDCENWHLLDALYRHQDQVLDYNLMACLDETPLRSVDLDNLCAPSSSSLMLYSLAPVVMLLIASLVALGICYYYRQELKVYLYARSICMFWVHEEELDRDKRFDAFVSYSHADEQFVHEHLVTELEREPHGFRLCIHTRDWLLGEWIPTQIAVSVEQSRRTIIVLSRHFLSSIWGRLEFRTAHINAMQEGRTRVIIILLEDIDDHEELDGELKTYLSSNTYVKWGDPHFWDKLRYALPHRRGERKARRSGEQVARDLQHITTQLAITPRRQSATPMHPPHLPAPQMLCIEAAPATAGAAI